MPTPAISTPSTSSRCDRWPPPTGSAGPAGQERERTHRQVDQEHRAPAGADHVGVDQQHRRRSGRGSWTGRSPDRARRTPCRSRCGGNRSRIRPNPCGTITAPNSPCSDASADQRGRRRRERARQRRGDEAGTPRSAVSAGDRTCRRDAHRSAGRSPAPACSRRPSTAGSRRSRRGRPGSTAPRRSRWSSRAGSGSVAVSTANRPSQRPVLRFRMFSHANSLRRPLGRASFLIVWQY